MKALLIPLLALNSLGCAGCSVVYSLNPLSNNADAVNEPALTGRWSPGDDEHVQACIEKSDQSTYTMFVSDEDPASNNAPKLVQVYLITPVRLEGRLFADVVAKGASVDRTDVERMAGAVNHHIIVKLETSDTHLRISLLQTSAIREANQYGTAPLSFVDIDDGLLLTASTDELRWAVSQHANLLFGEPEELTRVPDADSSGASPPPCSPPAAVTPTPTSVQ